MVKREGMSGSRRQAYDCDHKEKNLPNSCWKRKKIKMDPQEIEREMSA